MPESMTAPAQTEKTPFIATVVHPAWCEAHDDPTENCNCGADAGPTPEKPQ